MLRNIKFKKIIKISNFCVNFSTINYIENVKLSQCELIFKTGHLAKLATGAVEIKQNDNAILGVVVSKHRSLSESENTANFPTFDLQLNVDYRQSASAVGRIPMNFLRRELQQTEQDIATSRIIDRSLRPTFYQNYLAPTHIVCKPLSIDETGDSAVLGVNVASAAIAVSPIPTQCIVGAVRIGIINNNIVINPSMDTLKKSKMNLIITGTEDKKILMIEMDGKEILTEIFCECINQGCFEITKIIETIKNLAKKVNRPKWNIEEIKKEELLSICDAQCKTQLKKILLTYTYDKISRDTAITEIRNFFVKNNIETYQSSVLNSCFNYYLKYLLKSLTIENKIRCDGRKLNEFRPIKIRVNCYSKLHGSALFQRGQSQVFATTTFDSPQAAFHPDGIAQLLGAQRQKSFMLHYEFPQFAVNEIGSSHTNANRREIGHGLLAEKALKHVVPDNFPYTIRLSASVLESNGSTSMASACAGSLALYDAGVPLSEPVAGAAIGMFVKQDLVQTKNLINTESTKKNEEIENVDYVFLMDLFGLEDFLGDMDFKIAGTSKGFTAMQLDLKICGLTNQQLKTALIYGRQGIDHVLSKMNAVINQPRKNFKESVPIIEIWQLPSHYRRAILFRNNAFNAKLIESETGVQITAEDEQNLCLLAPNKSKLEKAKTIIEELLQEKNDSEYTFGAYYKAEIVEILESGIKVVLQKGTRPIFLPNSQLSNKNVGHASALNLEIGQHITIRYFGRDAQGYHRISRKMMKTPDIAIQNLIGKNTKLI